MPKVSVVTIPHEEIELTPHKVMVNHPPKIRIFYWLAITLKRVFLSLMQRDYLIVNFLAFLLGRVSILGEMSPFGLAFFFATAQLIGLRAMVVGFWIIAGLISMGQYMQVGVYIFSISCYFILSDKVYNLERRIKAVPLLGFATLFIAKLVTGFYQSLSFYGIMMAFIEASMCLVLCYLFLYGIPLFFKVSTKKQMSDEALACTLLILAVAVAGIGNVVIYGYSLRNTLGSFFIMLMALTAGAGIGTSVGVTVGLVVGLSDGNASLMVAIYSIAGFIAGTFRDIGRLGVILGFTLGSAFTVLYFGQASELTFMFVETAVAAVMLGCFSKKHVMNLGNKFRSNKELAADDDHKVDFAVSKLNNIAEMFNDLASNFNSTVTVIKEKAEKDELSLLLTSVGQKVCEKCSKRTECWDKEFYRTYHMTIEMFSVANEGILNYENAPEAFRDRCIKLKDFVDIVTQVSVNSNNNSFWRKKIIETQQTVSEQQKAISNILCNVVQDIQYELPCDKHMAAALTEKATILECPLEEVRVSGDQGNCTINIKKRPCGGTKECKNTILPLVASLMQEKLFLKAECGGTAHENCRLTIQVCKKFNVKTGMAYTAKQQNVSGDTCAVVPLSSGKIALILSDGMGSGTKAQGESSTTVRFLEKLLATGFEVKLAVKTVNSMLLLKSSEESFTTMDMAIIDTYSGETEFLKIGSAPSFIKRVGEVWTVNSSSLPIGILNHIEIDTINWGLAAGDVLIMVSDGIIDIANKNNEKESWLVNYLRKITSSHPQDIAEEILKQAKILSGGSIRDDMTVLVAKITEESY